jgi:predicted transcriptional regulator
MISDLAKYYCDDVSIKLLEVSRRQIGETESQLLTRAKVVARPTHDKSVRLAFDLMVGEKQVRRVKRDRWAGTRAQDLMVSGEALPRVAPETSLRDALDRLHRSGLDGLPVVESGAVTGIVTRRAVAKAVAEAARGRMRPGGAPVT